MQEKNLPTTPAVKRWLNQPNNVGLSEAMLHGLQEYPDPSVLQLEILSQEEVSEKIASGNNSATALLNIIQEQGIQKIPCLTGLAYVTVGDDQDVSKERVILRLALPISHNARIEGIQGRIEEFLENITLCRVYNGWSIWQ